MHHLRSFIKNDSHRERLRRARISGTYNLESSLVYEEILIRRIAQDRGLDEEAITTTLRDTPVTLKVGSEVIMVGQKTPLIYCNDLDIRRYVHTILPIEMDLSEEEVQEIKKQRKTLSRQLNKKRNRGIAVVVQDLRYIGGTTGNKRVIPSQREARKIKNKAQQKWLSNTLVVGKNGEKHRMADVGVTAKKRIAEMLCTSRGLQTYCEAIGMSWASVVVTLPTRFHPNPTRGSLDWDGTLPDNAMSVMNRMWANVRARLAKKKIKLAGFRTVESHQDGCPHINFMIYFPSGTETIVEATFRDVFGSSNRAVRFMQGTSGKGAAQFSSYAMKYFQKHLKDGNIDDATLAEQAWASAWNVRRFQFFGIPPLSVWRSLRASQIAPSDIFMQDAWIATRNGNFKDYIAIQGGLHISTINRALRPIYEFTKGGSPVAIGVANTISGYQHIVKEANYWKLEEANHELMNDDEDIPESPVNTTVTVILNYPSKTQTKNQNPKKPRLHDVLLRKSLKYSSKRLIIFREAQEKVAKTKSHRERVLSEIVKQRSIHVSYQFRLNMINSDLADKGFAHVNGLDNLDYEASYKGKPFYDPLDNYHPLVQKQIERLSMKPLVD